MGRPKTIGIKSMSRDEYNAYCREVQRRKRQRARAERPVKTPPTHRLCTRCNVVFPLTKEFFYEMKSTLGVKYFQSWCKTCRKVYNSTRHAPLQSSEGSCDICWRKGKVFTIYDRSASYIIGAMCGACRMMVNIAGNRPDLLRRAAEYLEDRS